MTLLIMRRSIHLWMTLAVLCASARAAVRFNEVYFYPPVVAGQVQENRSLEFIEIHNSGSIAVDVSGWMLTGGVEFTIGSFTIQPSGFLVVASDSAALSADYPGIAASIIGDFAGSLSNRGEEIRLMDGVGETVDEIDYADDGDWALRERGPFLLGHQGWVWAEATDGGGYSLELTTPALDGSYGAAWESSATAGGTPGMANSTLVTDAAPLLKKLRHQPAIPRSTERVRITVEAAAGTGSDLYPLLHFRRDGDPEFQALGMHDDGTNGDEEANDGEYTVELMPRPDGTVVEFYTTICDSEGLSRRYPTLPDGGLPGESTNYLYQINDGFDREDPLLAGQPLFFLTMTEVERAELEQIHTTTSEAGSNAQMNASIVSIVGGDYEVRHNVGVRNRGNTSRDEQPNNFRFNFLHSQPWEGVSSVDLNGQETPSRLIGSAVYQRAGIEVSRVIAARLRVNGTDLSFPVQPSYSLYGMTETYGGDWVDNHFPNDNDGNLYRVSRQGLEFGTSNAFLKNRYSKETNEGDDDFSDIGAMLIALHQSTDQDFLTAIEPHIDLEQWARFFAVSALVNNRETNISTGRADDFALYRGVIDPRFKLVPHDLDFVMSDFPSLGLLVPANNDGLARLFTRPEFMTKYFGFIREYAAGLFSDAEMVPFLQEILGGLVDQSVIDSYAANNTARRDWILTQLPTDFTVVSALPVVHGLPETSSSTTDFSGVADMSLTHGVLVGGQVADYDAATGQWSMPAATLFPGENNVLVQFLDGDGQEFERRRIRVRYNTGAMNLVTTVSTDRTLTAAGGPWYFGGGTTFVNSGSTLTVEAGATVYFSDDSILRTAGTSNIVVNGTDLHRAQFSRIPSDGTEEYQGLWLQSGITVQNTISHLDMRYSGATRNRSIFLADSHLLLDSVVWEDSPHKVLQLTRPYLELRNCVLPTLPSGEMITGKELTGDMYLILDGNTFGGTTGYADIIDFAGGQRPGPIIQVLNNTFLGGSDEVLDLDGADAHIEGNVFMNVHKNHTSPSTCNVISTGIDDGNSSDLTVVRNVFYDVDHALLLKDGSSAVFENNVVIGATIAALNFGEPERGVPYGDSAVIRGNIFLNNAETLKNLIPAVTVQVDQNNIPIEHHALGFGNIDEDPLFEDVLAMDFQLRPDSPSRFVGPNGIDMGVDVPQWCSLSGEPGPITVLDTATLTVDGPGIVAYRYSLDGGAYGVETQITDPIQLSGLAPGTHQVAVIGRNSAGVWQDVADATLSLEWTIDGAVSPLRFSEVLASNAGSYALADGSFPDLIEIHNAGAQTIDLSGYMLTDDPAVAGAYQFPTGSSIAAGEFLLLHGGTGLLPGVIYTGFSVSSGGETLQLRDALGQLLDSVTFGLQVSDFSIARVGSSAAWVIADPTPGAPNSRAQTGLAQNLVINEWLSLSEFVAGSDFVELYNPGSLPVSLGGLALSDRPAAEPQKQIIAPLSFIGPLGFASFHADRIGEADGLEFKLASLYGDVGLLDGTGEVIDQVAYDAQLEDQSRGRMPDGGVLFEDLPYPTPGLGNTAMVSQVAVDLITFEDSWKYDESGADLGMVWRDLAYDDSAWLEGPTLIAKRGSDTLAVPIRTVLNLHGGITYYFRKEFEFQGDPAATTLVMNGHIDDGVVFYLNGQELSRLHMPAGPIDYLTAATRSNNGVAFDPMVLSGSGLVQGTNVLSAEVHQVRTTSSDVVFGVRLTAEEESSPQALLDGLRVTEIHYNPTGGSDEEFLELRNVGGTSLNLNGVRLDGAIDFEFDNVSIVAGERIVIARDVAAFQAVHGTAARVFGPYSGKLSNGGEEVIVWLPAPHNIAIQRFEYNDDWHPTTDGDGPSLVVVDPLAPKADWGRREGWQPSVVSGGTPGVSFVKASISAPAYLAATGSAALEASVVDEGLPLSGLMPDFDWSQVSGPTGSAFSTPDSASTTFDFATGGRYTIRLEVLDPAGIAAAEQSVVVGSDFDSWIAQNFSPAELLDASISGENADADCDGHTNLEEYAFGTDPRTADLAMISLEPASGGAQLIFPMPLWISDVVYGLEYSPDLVNWLGNSEGVKILRRDTDPSGADFGVGALIVQPSELRSFVRVRLSRP